MWSLVLGGALTLLGGCLDNRPFGQGAGAECGATAECGPGLECVGRVCVAAPPGRRPGGGVDDVGFAPSDRDADGGFDDPDLPPPMDVGAEDVDLPADADRPDVDPPDGELLCRPGERECASNDQIRVCRRDGQGFELERCAQGTICQGGACVPRDECQDADGDGFGASRGCEGALDCNDANPAINPRAGEACNGLDDDCDGQVDEALQRVCRSACGQGTESCRGGRFVGCTAPLPAMEVCNNRDDDCDGQVDEGVCDECCEPGSCPQGQICVDCDCREAPSDQCLFQNQPCNPFEVGVDGEFACVDFAGQSDGICFGTCSFNAPDPDSTCPEPGSVCAFEIDDGGIDGLCLAECDPGTQTGCFEGQGCIALRDTGGCVPVGDTPEGEECNPEVEVFGVCEAGLICTQVDQFSTTCERLCHPFAGRDELPALCQGETACFSFDTDFGLCFPSLDLPEGSACSRAQGGTMCGDDVICHPAGQGRFACAALCRLDRGEEDCSQGRRCRESQFVDGSSGVGVCR